MGQSDRFDPDATPPYVPRTPGEPPFEEPTQAVPTDPTLEPTRVLPQQPVAARTTAPVGRAVTEPVYTDPRYTDPMYDPRLAVAAQRREAWPYVLAVVALLLGGLGGFLLGAALDDDDETVRTAEPPATVPDGSDVAATLDMLLERTRADGEYRTPSEYPQLDEITEIDNAAATAALEQQLAALAEAEGDVAGLAQQVAALETALAEVTAERDALATAAESGDGDAELQAQLDAANARITTLEADLTTARSQLDTATADLQTARTERDAAVAELDALGVVPVPDYVNGDVARARTDAAANGWTLIEETVESGAAPGTVIEQSPRADSDMVRGAVLYVTVAGNV